MHYQRQFSFLLCLEVKVINMITHMIINNSALFMSMSNLILININIMDMKRHILILFFHIMLVSKKRSEIITKIRDNY